MKDAIRISGWPLSAFVLLQGWGWFVVPLGVPALTFWHAMGLGLLSNCFMRDRSEKGLKEFHDTSLEVIVTQAFVLPSFLLALLWLASLGMP